jgi:hypothetical protein
MDLGPLVTSSILGIVFETRGGIVGWEAAFILDLGQLGLELLVVCLCISDLY